VGGPGEPGRDRRGARRGLVEAFPGTLPEGATRLVYSLREVIGVAFAFEVGREGRTPGWVNLLLGLFGAIALFAALYVLLRSQRAVATLDADEERRVRELLASYGHGDSLGYFAARDKEVIFSPSGRAAVTYRVVFGVSLASGDPIGNPEAWGPAIGEWLREAREYAWTPAVIGASEAGATAYARAGLAGDPARGRGDPACTRVRPRQARDAPGPPGRAPCRAGLLPGTHPADEEVSADEMAHAIELAARWRDTETERGFSMALGRLGDPNDGRCVLVEAYNRDGREVALLSFTPGGDSGLSLDLMRRDRASDNGLMEFMVSTLMREAPRLGVERVSLNFAVFRAVFSEGARIGAWPVLRAWRRLLLLASRWFQIESLYRSNVKYGPRWLPRFLCYEDLRDLAKVGLASGVAEGFVRVPSLRTLLRRGASAPTVEPRPATRAVEPRPVRPAVEPRPVTLAPEAPPRSTVPPARAPEQTHVQISKVDGLRAGGTDPYPPGFERTHTCAGIRDAYRDLPPAVETGDKVAVAGRLVLMPDHGALCFATLRDWTGDVQVMVAAHRVGRSTVDAWRASVDLGDHVGVAGEVITTRRGELSVAADTWRLTAKCLRPLPDKHKGVADTESLVRERHVDLIVNPAAREMIRTRSAVTFALRSTL
jgi:lysyl-tRNA synthetase, class II